MHLTVNELDALVQHLRAHHPQDDHLRSVRQKAEADLRAYREIRKKNDRDVGSAKLQRDIELAAITRYSNPGVASGAKRPKDAPKLLKNGARLSDPQSAEELLSALGLEI